MGYLYIFPIFNPTLMKLGEVVVIASMFTTASPSFIINAIKNKKDLSLAHLKDVLSFKVPLRSCKGAGELGHILHTYIHKFLWY